MLHSPWDPEVGKELGLFLKDPGSLTCAAWPLPNLWFLVLLREDLHLQVLWPL